MSESRPRVLVVDDDESVRDLLQRFLTKEGYAVSLASGGRDVVKLVKEIKPDVITLDVLMPDVDGWTVLRGHSRAVYAVAWSPDGSRLFSGSEDTTLRVWDGDTYGEIVRLRGHTDYVYAIAVSPDGRRLASASTDGTVKLWDAAILTADEKSARFLVDQLFDELESPDQVIEAIGRRDNWNDAMREAALAYVGERSTSAGLPQTPR